MLAKLLLDQGASIDEQDEEGWTALMKSSANGHTELVKLLLDQGASVNKKGEEGQTALMVEIFSGHTKVVKPGRVNCSESKHVWCKRSVRPFCVHGTARRLGLSARFRRSVRSRKSLGTDDGKTQALHTSWPSPRSRSSRAPSRRRRCSHDRHPPGLCCLVAPAQQHSSW